MRRPAWYRMPRWLRNELRAYLGPGERLIRPKREYTADRLIRQAFAYEVGRGRSRRQAIADLSRRFGVCERTIRTATRLVPSPRR